MDEKGRESGHLMLITPERVLYAGLVGRPRERRRRRKRRLPEKAPYMLAGNFAVHGEREVGDDVVQVFHVARPIGLRQRHDGG